MDAKNGAPKGSGDHILAQAYHYPLNGITYCYPCELLAQQHNNPKLRSRMGGKGRSDDGRYRHKHGVKCGCTNRSVVRDKYEADFGRLLKLLTVNEDEIDVMTELGILSLRAQAAEEGIDLDAQRRAAIAKCRRRMEAARHLYEDGEISREEYLKRKESNERE